MNVPPGKQQPQPLDLGGGLLLPLDIVTRRTAIVGQTDTGKTSTAVVLAEEARAGGAQIVVIDPSGAWWGITSSADGKSPGLDMIVMGGEHGDVPLNEHAGRAVARLVAGEGISAVLDLDRPHFTSWASRLRFVADFLSELYERSRSQILVIVDECHRFAPQSTGARDEEGGSARCLGAVNDVVALGRRRGLGFVAITQRLAKLNKDVLELCEVVVAHRLRGNNDRAQLRGWLEQASDDWKAVMAAVAGLDKGVAHVSAPTLGIDGVYAIRRKRTFDSSASIGVGETAAAPAVRSQVDLAAIEALMASTIEQAKADDPRELRRQLAALQTELAVVKAGASDQAKVDIDEHLMAERNLSQGELDDLARLLDLPVDGPHNAIRDYVATLLSEYGSMRVSVEAAAALGQQLIDLTAAGNAHVSVPVASEGVHATAAPIRPAEGVRGRDSGSNGSRRATSTLSAGSGSKQATGGARAQPAASSTSKQRILDALAMLEVIGVTAAPKVQLALFAQVSPKSSGYTNNLGALRSAGLVEYPAGGYVALTAAGRAEANAQGVPRGHRELLAYVRTLVGESRYRIVDALVEVYPGDLGKAELAERAGVSSTSSGYTNNLGSLRSLGLLDYPTPGRVAATPILFPARSIARAA